MGAYTCADLHLGHRNIAGYRKVKVPIENSKTLFHVRNFHNTEEHDDYVEKVWRERVRSNKRDITYVLGDVAFSKEAWERFDSFPGKKIVILGNHCTEYATAEFISQLKTVNSVHSMLRWKSMIMSHAPLHPDHLRGKRNLHGHLHSTLVRDRRYMNVSLEHTNMGPISLEEVQAEFERRQKLSHVFYSLGTKAAVRMVIQKCKQKLT